MTTLRLVVIACLLGGAVGAFLSTAEFLIAEDSAVITLVWFWLVTPLCMIGTLAAIWVTRWRPAAPILAPFGVGGMVGTFGAVLSLHDLSYPAL